MRNSNRTGCRPSDPGNLTTHNRINTVDSSLSYTVDLRVNASMLKKGAARRCILFTTLKNRPADTAGVGAFGARNAGGHALARRLAAAPFL